MSDIFREVDEALQQEKAEKIWKDYGSTIITAVFVMILTTAVFSGYKAWDNQQKEKQTSAIIAALDLDQPEEALSTLAQDSRKGHAMLAGFAAAGTYVRNGQSNEALRLYETLIAQNALPKDFKDLARLLSVRLQMKVNLDPSAEPLLKELAEITGNPKSPWLYHAKADEALIKAYYTQNYTDALSLLDSIIKSEDAPSDLKERVNAMIHVFQIKAEKDKINQVDPNPEG